MLETLINIKRDLDSTAAHFEQLSAAMHGYMIFTTTVRAPVGEVAQIDQSLKGLQHSIARLKSASAKIDDDFPL